MAARIQFGDANSGFQAGIIHGSVEYHAPPERVETPPHPSIIIPFARDRDFVQRGDLLDQIHQKCGTPGSRIALVGLGGVGKSQLAIEYAYRTHDQSPDTWVLWIHASNASRFDQSFRDIADQLKIVGRRDPKANVFKLVLDWLLDDKNGKPLIILDNFDDAKFLLGTENQSEASGLDNRTSHLLLQYISQNPKGSILITTRDRQVALNLVAQDEILTVNPMAESHAVDLLKKKLAADAQGCGEDVLELAIALELMPLAIVQAAAYISERVPRYSVRQYINDFQRSDRKKIGLLKSEVGHHRRDLEAQNSIILTWLISFERIREFHPSAADLLSLMSFFDRQGIPDRLLRRYTSEDLDIWAPECYNTQEDASNNFERYKSDYKSDWLDKLGRISPSDRNRLQKLEEGEEIAADSWSELGHDGESIDGQEPTNETHYEWYNHEEEEEEEEGEEEEDARDDSSSHRSSNDNFESDILTLRNYSFIACTTRPDNFKMHRLVQLATQAWLEKNGKLELWRRQFILNLSSEFPPAEHEDWETSQSLFPHAKLAVTQQPEEENSLKPWASLLHNAAWYASRAGNIRDAKSMSMKAMKTRGNLFGQENGEMLRSMEMLGSVLHDEGRLNEAEELQRRVMDSRSKMYGPDHPLVLGSTANLALTLSKQLRWNEAEILQIYISERFKAVLGAIHSDTLASMTNLASTYSNQGRLKEAENMQLEVMETNLKIFGLQHPSTLESMLDLARTYRSQGRYKESENIQLEVTETRMGILGAQHPSTLETMASIAITYQRQGRFEEAEDMQVELREIYMKIFGSQHPSTLESMTTLARTFQSQGRFKEAEGLQKQVLENRQAKLGPDHLETSMSMGDLATTFWRQGRFKEAEELQQQVRKRHQAKLGPDHLDTLVSMSNLAQTFRSQGRFREAEELLQQVRKKHQEKLGSDHLDTLVSMSNLGQTFRSQGRLKEAEELQQQVLENRQAKLGQDHPDTLLSMNDLAVVFGSQGRFKEAEELQRKVLKEYQKNVGKDHPNTLTAMNNLAMTRRSLGQPENALMLMKDCAEARQRVLGPEHPYTLSSLAIIETWR